jgi:hypothetical protein
MKFGKGMLVPVVAMALIAVTLAIQSGAANASSEPPPVIVTNPQSRSVTVGQSTTFTAVAKYAAAVV